MAVHIGEEYRFVQEVWFNGHQYSSFSNGGQAKIQRGSDGYYWNGSIFQASDTWVSTVVSGSTHYYDFTVPLTAVSGDTYSITLRVTDDPDTEFVGNMIVREEATGSGGGSVSQVFDAVDFITGFPSTVG